MTTIEIVIIAVIVALYIGWKASQAYHLLQFRSILEDLGVSNTDLRKLAEQQGIELDKAPLLKQDSEEESELPVLEIRIEQQPEGLFAYRKDNSLFIARGSDRKELMDNLVANLNNVRVVVAQEDGADLIRE